MRPLPLPRGRKCLRGESRGWPERSRAPQDGGTPLQESAELGRAAVEKLLAAFRFRKFKVGSHPYTASPMSGHIDPENAK